MMLHHLDGLCGLMADGCLLSVFLIWIGFELIETRNNPLIALSLPILVVGYAGLLFTFFGFLTTLVLALNSTPLGRGVRVFNGD